ncbi:MAG: hypothetical protein M3378_00810 [Actinomycetota bacterium]|nr:hypothetical protein [Actinomycetota bacterium]
MLQVFGSVVAPTTLLTALLYYFGWARTSSQAQFLGLDDSVLGYSTQDYLLRSISAMFLPLGAILLLALVWASGHVALSRWMAEVSAASAQPDAVTGPDRRRPPVVWLTWGLIAIGMALLTLGLLGAVFPRQAHYDLVTPMSFGLGAALTSYGVFLRRRWLARPSASSGAAGEARWLSSLTVTLVALVVALSLFWAVSDYAGAVGRGRGQQLVANLARRPSVVVYSPKRLQFNSPGVRETALEDPDAAYRFRYSGLKLLFRSNDKYFLLPVGWSVVDGSTIVLPDTEALRVEFRSSGTRSEE